MNISAWSIKNPLPVLMFFIIFVLIGLNSFNSMSVQNFPDMALPTININASLNGANPEQLENEVAKKIEDSLASLNGIKNISTTITEGNVSINAEFRLEKPVQEAYDDVSSAVSSIQAQLPQSMSNPVVNKVKTTDSPILTFAIKTQHMNETELSWYIDNNIAKEMLAIKGVGKVTRVGGVNREIHVAINPVKLKELGLTVSALSTQLKNLQVETSSGKIEIGGAQQSIKATAKVTTADELNKIEFYSGNKKIKLLDIATVEDTYARVTSAAYLNGEKIIGFEVARAKGYGELEIAKVVREKIVQLANQNKDIEIIEAYDFVSPIKNDYHASVKLLIEGGVLAVIVVFIFLRDWRATIVSAVALPLSIIPTFVFMAWMGFTLNIITLLALSLVIGILVDDAIVEVENIARHLQMGKSAYEASMEATQEIGLAVIATTFTLIGVFLPTAFMSGIPGLIFKQFGWTAAISVFASLVVARLLTPLMAAYIMKKTSSYGVHEDPKWMKTYLSLVSWSLKNRLKTIIFAILFFILSLVLIPMIKTSFIPANNSSQTQVSIELEPGTTFETAEKVVKIAEKSLKEIKEIEQVYSTIGTGSSGAQGGVANTETRKANLIIKLIDMDKRPVKQLIEENIRQSLQNVPGAKIKVMSGGNGEKYVISLMSSDGELLKQSIKNIETELAQHSDISNFNSDLNLSSKQLSLKINNARAAELGITTAEIAETVRVATQGDYDTALSKMNSSERQIPIVVKMNDEFIRDLDNIKSLSVQGKNDMIPLSEIVEFEWVNSPAQISRYNRSRNLNIDIELGTKQLGEMAQIVSQMSSIKNLPQGVTFNKTGEAERMEELFGNFGIAMLTGVLCIYLILVLLFKDILQPFTILMALPLSLGGAFVALLVAGQNFSMPSLIGLIMLMGVSTKNSILLVDYAIMARQQGIERFEAVLDACHKRARPIIMTTLAMGAGMLPVAMQWGSGDGSFRAPMAVAVIGGLLTSTILSLLVIPSVFTYVDDFKNFFKRNKENN